MMRLNVGLDQLWQGLRSRIGGVHMNWMHHKRSGITDRRYKAVFVARPLSPAGQWYPNLDKAR